jgi:phage terminase Nu1 subunit (DNA packaging protein)
LKAIAADATDMEMLEHRLEGIVAAMRLVRESAETMDLEQLERRAASIATTLKMIAETDVVKELKAS